MIQIKHEFEEKNHSHREELQFFLP